MKILNLITLLEIIILYQFSWFLNWKENNSIRFWVEISWYKGSFNVMAKNWIKSPKGIGLEHNRGE